MFKQPSAGASSPSPRLPAANKLPHWLVGLTQHPGASQAPRLTATASPRHRLTAQVDKLRDADCGVLTTREGSGQKLAGKQTVKKAQRFKALVLTRAGCPIVSDAK